MTDIPERDVATDLWPDRASHALPTRAYLRSVLDQTIPARKAALRDSIDHFHEALSAADRGWSDVAFLGVIADALQVLEDFAYVGESFSYQRFAGLPYYVGAITYDPGAPTRFYSRKRSNDDLRVLASYAVRDPATGSTHDVTDLVGGNLDVETRTAWREAEDVTIAGLSEVLAELSECWSRFGKYFHAFKHGGLVANRDDYALFDADGEPKEAAIAVWLRRKDEPSPHGTDQAGQIDAVVEHLQQQADSAFEVLDLVISSRLGFSEFAATREPGPADETIRMELPVRFKLGASGISDDSARRLEAIGVRFYGRDPI